MSYDPLRIYLFRDGLARFATVKFDASPAHYHNLFMHLTNYSINKQSPNYVACTDEGVEDYGNKWSLSALLQHLQAMGIDTAALMARIEDVVIKSIIAVQEPISAATRMYTSHPGTCAELYGFDVLIDTALRPWVLEVNLSPSLACDAPLDMKIKSHVVADFMSLTMMPPCDAAAVRRLGSHAAAGGGSRPRSHAALARTARELMLR